MLTKLVIIFENKVFQKLKLSDMFFNNKSSTKLLYLIEMFFKIFWMIFAVKSFI